MNSIFSPMLDAVLDDCVNQLVILGTITGPNGGKQSRTKLSIGDEIGEIVNEQHSLEQEYDRVIFF